MAAIFNIPTIGQLATNYKNYAQSNSSLINPFIPYTDWDFKANAIASLVAGMYQDMTVNAQAIFPQYRSGTQVDISLANAGLIPRQPATFGMISSTANSSYPGNVGDQVTNLATGSIYNFYSLNATNNLTIWIASNPGIGNVESIGAVLTLVSSNATPPTFTVSESIDGTTSETDSACITRLINASATPLAGGRYTDYYQFCLDANNLPNGGGTIQNTITDAIIIPSVNTNPTNANLKGVVQLGIYGLIGGQFGDYELNQGLLNGTAFNAYSRAFNSLLIAGNIQTSIYNQKLAGLNPVIGTCSTFILPTDATLKVSLQVNVVLVPNTTLTTPITVNSSDQYGNPITVTLTVRQLIEREVRRALVSQPLGAVGVNQGQTTETRTIPLASIEQQLDYSLGASSTTGIYASLLVDRTVYNPVAGVLTRESITVPTSLQLSGGNIQFTYDVGAYNLIGVAIV